MNAYEFIVRMKDYATSGLRKIGLQVGVTRKETTGLNKTLRATKRLLASAFLAIGISSFVSNVVEARSEYEKFRAVLTNTFQSADVGDSALSMLTDFAAKTPFQLNNLTGSFVKLVNRGFNPTRKELTQLGDLAASQGKSFDQLTEAILDAETKEFERLKEFGIKARNEGEKIALAFKGQTKVIDNNSRSIRNALLQYGNMEGVAGSMDAISKTLGGRISNLKDRWNSFLVAVGGEGGGVLSGVIDLLGNGIAFLTGHLSEISMWFKILWSYLEPVGVALWNFIQAAFGFSSAGEAVAGFGSIMQGVLLVVDWLSTGLISIIGWLTPFADVIGIATAAWAALNLVFAISPLGWIVIGIMAIITAIGMISKYTSGWGEAWQHVVTGAKLLWKGFVETSKANFNTMVQALMFGIDKIKLGWYKFKEAVGMGDSSANQKMIADINNQIERRKKSVVDGYKKAIETNKQALQEFGKVKIDIDKEGIKNDFQNLKNKFSGLGQTGGSNNSYSHFLDKNRQGDTKGSGAVGSGKGGSGESIISGGTKKTNINITIQKLQDDTKIYVSSKEEGLNDLGERIQELMLRAVNSVNQMQTG